MDCGFPVITYTPEKDPREWGFSHGEQWRDAIQELVAIRKNLMRERNPGLDVIAIDHLAGLQANITRRCYPELMQEFDGIAAGAGLSLVDLVILNNYTDFRDIQWTIRVAPWPMSTIRGNRWSGRPGICMVPPNATSVVWKFPARDGNNRPYFFPWSGAWE